eukprot:scaffold31775_cov79-Cyclotella_meneghiniana.AAC.5
MAFEEVISILLLQWVIISCSAASPNVFFVSSNFRYQRKNWRACESSSAIKAVVNEPCNPPVKQRYHYDLTILIPAYNEVDRIGDTLSEYIAYLSQNPVYQPNYSRRSTGNASILVIDDGSIDNTADFVTGKSYLEDPFVSEKPNDSWVVDMNIECITLPENEGKGAAIEMGINKITTDESNGEHHSDAITRRIVLVADADGSGDISCLNNLIHQLELVLQKNEGKEAHGVIAGYRACADKSFLRGLLSWGFRTAVSSIFLGGLGVRDTQCGFKLMTVSTGKKLYNNLNLRRWTHDVEIFYRAHLMSIPVNECEVPWCDKAGSKLVTSTTQALTISFVMLKEIAEMRVRYIVGDWRVE